MTMFMIQMYLQIIMNNARKCYVVINGIMVHQNNQNVKTWENTGSLK